MSEESTPNLSELIQQMNGAKTLSEFMEAYSKAKAEDTDVYRYVETAFNLSSVAQANLARLYVECKLGNMSQDELEAMKEKGGKYAQVAGIIENRQKKDKSPEVKKVNVEAEKVVDKISEGTTQQPEVNSPQSLSRIRRIRQKIEGYLDKLLGKEEVKDEQQLVSTNVTHEEQQDVPQEGLRKRLEWLRKTEPTKLKKIHRKLPVKVKNNPNNMGRVKDHR